MSWALYVIAAAFFAFCALAAFACCVMAGHCDDAEQRAIREWKNGRVE